MKLGRLHQLDTLKILWLPLMMAVVAVLWLLWTGWLTYGVALKAFLVQSDAGQLLYWLICCGGEFNEIETGLQLKRSAHFSFTFHFP